MSSNEPADSYRRTRGPSLGRSWHANEITPDVTRRLSRSATIALLLSPVGILIVSVIRLLIIADYNTTTALAIASSGGYINTLFGTVIPLVPIFLPYVALGLLFSNRVILAIAALLAVAFVSPMAVSRATASRFISQGWHSVTSGGWHIVYLVSAALVVLVLVGELVGWGYNTFFKTLSSIACIALIPIFLFVYPFPLSNTFYAEQLRRPWLPAEEITLNSGQVLIGYLLSEDQDWVVILKADSRTIYYYHEPQVTNRQICQLEHTSANTPLISLIPSGQKQPIPPCEASPSNATPSIRTH
jgi:hypothetical protein